MSFFTVIIFFGGWLPIPLLSLIIPFSLHFSLKVLLILFIFIWIRSTLPRFRFDQLMILGWKCLLPLSLGWLIFSSSLLLIFDLLPN